MRKIIHFGSVLHDRPRWLWWTLGLPLTLLGLLCATVDYIFNMTREERERTWRER